MSRKKKSGWSQINIVKAIVATALMAFLIFATKDRLNSTVDDVNIIIETGKSEKELINQEEVRELLKEHIGFDIGISSNTGLDLMDLERILEQDARVEEAEIYIDKRNRIRILIIQKEPIVRIEVTGGEDYYLDNNGSKIPIIKGQIVRVPIVTGHIDTYQPDYKNDEDHNLNMILTMANRVDRDEFLHALVEQIHIDQADEIVIVPKMGRTKILLGHIDDMDEKVYKLKTYYKKGIKNIGIDKFDELNMKYEGQILGVNNT